MESNDVECLFRKGSFVIFENSIHVFIVSPTDHQIIKSGVWLINSVFGVVVFIISVRISLERVTMIDDIFRPLASDDKCIPDNGPLWLACAYILENKFSFINSNLDF
jgi:hypothetical protein